MSISTKGLLVAIEGQQIQLCAPQCAPVAAQPPTAVMAIGRMPNGDIWAMEAKGTLLRSKEGAKGPGPWSQVVSDHAVDWSRSDLLKNPWMHHQSGGQISAGPPRPPQPSIGQPAPPSAQGKGNSTPASGQEAAKMTWVLRGVGLGICLLAAAFYFLHNRKRPRP